MTQHKHFGSSLDDLLESDGTLERAEAEALKRVIVWQIQQAMGNTGEGIGEVIYEVTNDE